MAVVKSINVLEYDLVISQVLIDFSQMRNQFLFFSC